MNLPGSVSDSPQSISPESATPISVGASRISSPSSPSSQSSPYAASLAAQPDYPQPRNMDRELAGTPPNPSISSAPSSTFSPSGSTAQTTLQPTRTSPKLPTKYVFALLIICLLIIAGAIVAGLCLRQPGTVHLANTGMSQTTQAQLAAQQTPDIQEPPFQPVTTLHPLLQSCLFNYFGGCVQRITQNIMNNTNQYQNYAYLDVPYVLQFHHNSALPTHQETPTPDQLQAYFPELAGGGGNAAGSAAGTSVSVAAPQILLRVSAKQNVNPRVLLALMEVMYTGQGPLLSAQTNPQYPYFSNTDDFFTQVVNVATELRQDQLKYTFASSLPQTMTFYNASYTVGSDMNAESLAIMQFLANHIDNRQDFERAISIPPASELSGVGGAPKFGTIIPHNDFVALYTTLFETNPLTNAYAPGAAGPGPQ